MKINNVDPKVSFPKSELTFSGVGQGQVLGELQKKEEASVLEGDRKQTLSIPHQ